MADSTLLINFLFSLVMLTLAWIDIRSFGTSRHRDFKSLIVSVGILGTFFGIFWGLQQFDTGDIQNSVPHLLEGLKVAFFTSIAGMALAIILGIYQKLHSKKSSTEEEMDYAVNQLEKLDKLDHLDQLRHLEKLEMLTHLVLIEKHQKTSQKNLEELKIQQQQHAEALSALLVEQFERTHESLAQAIRQLAQGASKELIEALEQVIGDFNTNLSEQFGDNFKELNAAVAKMIDWQEGYKRSIELIESTLKQSGDSLQTSATTLHSISERNREVMQTYEQLRAIIETYRQQTEELNSHLTTYASLEAQSRAMFAGLEKGFTQSIEHSDALYRQLSQQQEDLGAQISLSTTESQTALTQLTQQVRKTMEHLLQHLQTTLESSFQNVLAQHQKQGAEILKHSAQHSGQIRQEMEALHRSLSENNQTINTQVAQAYTALSQSIREALERFSSDVSGLSANLQEEGHTLKRLWLEHLQALQQDWNQAAAQHSERLNESLRDSESAQTARLESLQQHLHDSADAIAHHSRTVQEQAVQSLTQMSETTLSSIQETTQTSQQRHDETIARFRETLQQLGDSLQERLNGTQTLLTGLASSLQQQGETTHESIQQTLTLMRENIEQERNAIQQGIEDFGRNVQTTMESLGDSSREHWQAIQEGFSETIAHTSQDLADKLLKMEQQVVTSHSRLTTEYLKFLQKQIRESNVLPEQIGQEMQSVLKAMSETLGLHLKQMSDEMEANQKTVSQLIRSSRGLIETEVKHASELNGELRESMRDLDQALSSMTQHFRNDYEWFLRRVKELMGSGRGY